MYSKRILEQSIRAIPSCELIYLNNPKVGCSAIKVNIWSLGSGSQLKDFSRVHDVQNSPFETNIEKLDWVEKAKVFSFVRNPFTRIVSAYLNKITRREPGVWGWFSKRYALQPGADISFRDFIDLIHADSPDLLDPHWRPQYINILYPLSAPNFIGHLEYMDEQIPEVFSRLLGLPDYSLQHFRPHKTNASDVYREFLADPDLRKKVIDLYFHDFQYFSYSMDVDHEPEPLRRSAFNNNTHPGLALLQRFYQTTDHAARLKLLPEVDHDLVYPHVSAWELAQRLTAVQHDAVRVKALLEQNIQAVRSGPEFLKRLSAKIAGQHGLWELNRRIVNAPD